MCFEVSNALKILQSFCLCLNEKQILSKGVEDLDRMTMSIFGEVKHYAIYTILPSAYHADVECTVC